MSLVELAELYGKEPTFRTGRVGGDRSKGCGQGWEHKLHLHALRQHALLESSAHQGSNVVFQAMVI